MSNEHIEAYHIRIEIDGLFNLPSTKKAKKLSKIPRPTDPGGISRERFKQGSRTFTRLSRTIGLTNLKDMTSLSAPGWLQNAIKYCTKCVKRVRPVKVLN